MGTRTKYEPNELCWVDLMAADLDAAATFYSSLLGCEVVKPDTQGGPPYYMLQRDGHSLAGMGALPPEMATQGIPPHWGTYVNTPDLEAACERVSAAGGQVAMPPTSVGPAGSMAMVLDPTGAGIRLWKADRHIGAGLVNVPGTWVWNELTTAKLDEALAFYEAAFDWTASADDMPDGSKYWGLKRRGDEKLQAGAMLPPPGTEGQPPNWSVYFAVESIETAKARVGELGGQVLMPLSVPAGEIAVCTDPGGAVFLLIEMAIEVDE